MNILIIDDDKTAVKGIIDFSQDKKWSCEVVGFEKYEEHLKNTTPDVIILDWKNDADNNSDDNAGHPIFEDITNNRFCPIIIFSALVGSIENFDAEDSENLIYREPKGDESVVTELLEKLHPYVESIKCMKTQMNAALMESTKAIKHFIDSETETEPNIVKYMLNKRASQFFDKELFLDDSNTPVWIQYEYPPIQKHFAVADILRKKNLNEDNRSIGNPEDYAIVLTPTCDLAQKIPPENVMISSGGENKGTYVNFSTEKNFSNNRVDSMRRCLTQGYNGSKIPIPELKNEIPYMCFNMKKIEIVKYVKIAQNAQTFDKTKHDYYRVASIISPYREQIVWAFMNNICRPGVPDRNYIQWAEGMLTK